MWGGPLVRGRPLAGLLLVVTSIGAQTSAELAAKAATEARKSERLDQALTLYQRAVALQAEWAEGWWFLGTLQYDRDAYAAAAAAFQKLVELRPKEAPALLMLGLCEAKLGRPASALQHLEQGRKLGFTDDAGMRRVVLFTEGRLRLESGEFGKAQAALDAVARDGATQEELVVALGQAVLGIRSTSQVPQEIIRRAGWAEHFAAKGDFQAAAREYSSLAADAGKTHDVQFAYGRFLLANHQDDEAVEAFQREIQNTPNHLLARLGIAGIKLAKDPAAGLLYAQQAVELAPQLAEPHYLAGAILLETGQTSKAIAELETARRIDSSDARVHFKLSRAYARAGRRQDAASANAAFNRLNDQAAPTPQE